MRGRSQTKEDPFFKALSTKTIGTLRPWTYFNDENEPFLNMLGIDAGDD